MLLLTGNHIIQTYKRYSSGQSRGVESEEHVVVGITDGRLWVISSIFHANLSAKAEVLGATVLSEAGDLVENHQGLVYFLKAPEALAKPHSPGMSFI